MGDAIALVASVEPLGLRTEASAAPAGHPALRSLVFEYTSRGDRVAARLLLPPEGDGPHPVVLVQHGAGGAKDASYLDAVAGPWAARGAAVASLDLPLHGGRADAKLRTLLETGLQGRLQTPHVTLLAEEFTRQAVADLRRAIDALDSLPMVDATRVAFAGFSLGAMVGAIFCGLDPRPGAVVLALAGAGLGPESLDPAHYVGGIAPRPVLCVNAEQDQTIQRASAEALFRAAGEPRQQLWVPGSHDALPGNALKAMWEFMAPHLRL